MWIDGSETKIAIFIFLYLLYIHENDQNTKLQKASKVAMCKSFILLTCLHFQDPYDEHQQPHNQMNQYESEYQKQKQQKSASFKKIEDEYSAMKAALLSSMDSEDECSDEGFPNQDPSHLKISFEALPQTLKSDQTHPNVSGHPKVTPSKLNSSRSSLEESVSLNNPHGNTNQLVLDSKLKLGSSNADNVTHEDVLVRTISSLGPSAANLNPGRVLDVSSLCWSSIIYLTF